MEETDVVVVSTKGQVVIPQSIRRKLGISAKSKLLVYPFEDALIMKKLEVEDAERSLEKIYRRISARTRGHHAPSEDEVNELVQKYRHGRD